jgi:hypothetical protein
MISAPGEISDPHFRSDVQTHGADDAMRSMGAEVNAIALTSFPAAHRQQEKDSTELEKLP